MTKLCIFQHGPFILVKVAKENIFLTTFNTFGEGVGGGITNILFSLNIPFSLLSSTFYKNVFTQTIFTESIFVTCFLVSSEFGGGGG